MTTKDYPRDLIGYGRNPPQAQWPGNAKIAVQFVLNYEEGGENCVLHGDPSSETFLSEIIGAQAFDARHLSMESMYEYGSRVGAWRILKEFEKRGLPLTVFGVSMALQRHPELTQAFLERNDEIEARIKSNEADASGKVSEGALVALWNERNALLAERKRRLGLVVP